MILPLLRPTSARLPLPPVTLKAPVFLPPTKTLPPSFRLKLAALVPAMAMPWAPSRLKVLLLVSLP